MKNSSVDTKQEEYYNIIINFCNQKNYTLLTSKTDIKNTQSEVKYICSEHGEYVTKVRSILEGKSCYKCSRRTALINKNKTTLTDRQNALYNKALNACDIKGYILNSKKESIKNNISVIEYICPVHGKHSMRISNLITGRGCPDCAMDKRKAKYQLPIEEVELRISSFGGTLMNKTDYINNMEKNLKIKCSECGNSFITSLRNFTQHGGQVCSDCFGVESNGERKIRHYLENNNIVFEQEKWFSDCRDCKPLPFDFFLPNENCIIEFDGRQHYSDTGHFSYSLAKTKHHDNIKNKYCNDNNINLIRIPYWKYNNIERILNNQIHMKI